MVTCQGTVTVALVSSLPRRDGATCASPTKTDAWQYEPYCPWWSPEEKHRWERCQPWRYLLKNANWCSLLQCLKSVFFSFPFRRKSWTGVRSHDCVESSRGRRDGAKTSATKSAELGIGASQAPAKGFELGGETRRSKCVRYKVPGI